MQALRSKLTYANVISTMALFLVLGGGAAFAAGRLAPNSVGAAQLKNAAVTGPKIKRASIETTKLTQLAINTLKGQRGAKGATGAKGAKGSTGARGDTGPRGVTGATGPAGAPGSPGAAATVLVTPTLTFKGTHPGFAAVERPEPPVTGVYCLAPTNGTDIAHPVASANWVNSTGSGLFVEPLAGDISSCKAGQLEVHTSAVVAGTPTASDEVSFTVFAPAG